MFDQKAYDEFLIKNGVVGFYEDPITLRSGGLSYWYANFRALLVDVRLADRAGQFIYDFSIDNGLKPTNFFAVPEGPREFAGTANRLLLKLPEPWYETPISAASLRAGYKTHGSPLDRYSVGPVFSWMKPVIIEDVSTTGNSSTEFVMLLQELGITPISMVSMLSRMERRNDRKTVKEFVENDYGVKYFAMTSAETVLPKAAELLKPKEKVLKGLREELSDLSRYIVSIEI